MLLKVKCNELSWEEDLGKGRSEVVKLFLFSTLKEFL